MLFDQNLLLLSCIKRSWCESNFRYLSVVEDVDDRIGHDGRLGEEERHHASARRHLKPESRLLQLGSRPQCDQMARLFFRTRHWPGGVSPRLVFQYVLIYSNENG